MNWGYAWELDPNTPAVALGPGQTYDLYAALFHEFTHALGFGSEIFGPVGASTDRFGAGGEGSGAPGTWARWDQFLTNCSSAASLVNSTTFEVNQAAFGDAQNTGGCFAGANALAANGGPIKLYANPDQSHLDEATFSTPNSPTNFMMKPLRDYGPQEARVWSGLEVGILTDLGYQINAVNVPEPATALLVLAALAGLRQVRRKG